MAIPLPIVSRGPFGEQCPERDAAADEGYGSPVYARVLVPVHGEAPFGPSIVSVKRGPRRVRRPSPRPGGCNETVNRGLVPKMRAMTLAYPQETATAKAMSVLRSPLENGAEFAPLLLYVLHRARSCAPRAVDQVRMVHRAMNMSTTSGRPSEPIEEGILTPVASSMRRCL